ncbi:MAG: glycosyltransferase family 4 protein [Acidobacteria bacterium]|nr:glycosyltransferase family 4 protein [Acidobacteriota bacterium]
MRILILHMRFHPDLTGTGPLVTDLATDLAAMGDQVTVVTSMPHYGRESIPSEFRGRLLHRSRFQGVDVWRTFVYVPPNPSGFHRSLNYLSYTFMSVVAGLMCGRPDVILCVNPPITVGLSGWVIGLVRRVPMVFNVQDVWPDCLTIIGQLRSPWLTRIFKGLEKLIYRASCRVTVLSEGMKQNLMNKGVPEEKIAIIPNWANLDGIRPGPKHNGFREAHQLDGQFVVTFAGNIGYIAVLDKVLEAARLLREDPRIVFLIVGEGNAKRDLVEKAKALGLQNVRFLPTQPKEVFSEMLNATDAGLVTLNRSLGQLNVPSKTYSIMASGQPVLAAVPEDSEITRLIHEARCGVWVPPEDPRALASAIQRLVGQPEERRQFGLSGRSHIEKHYARSIITRRIRALLQLILTTDKRG